jgi:hypothetical protein
MIQQFDYSKFEEIFLSFANFDLAKNMSLKFGMVLSSLRN